MTNFLDAIQVGLDSAVNRESNFMEIHGILKSLKDQIEVFSEEKITLECIYFFEGDIFDYFKTNESLYEDKTLYICAAVNPDVIFHTLTEVKFSENGYPCTIEINENHLDAMDKSSLEDNIKILLTSPSVGQKIFDIMKKLNTK